MRLVRGIRFDAAVVEREQWLRSLALRLTRSSADAQDLLQDTIERALCSWERFVPGTNLSSWLASIMNNVFIDNCRTGSRGSPVALEDIAEEVAQPPAEREPAWARLGHREVRAALEHLRPSPRDVYALHLDGLSYQEIADRLGIPRPTVGTRLLRARKKLREVLSQGLGPTVELHDHLGPFLDAS